MSSQALKHIHQGTHPEMANHDHQQMNVEVTDERTSNHNGYIKQAILLTLWYLFSFFTIVLNKYILTILGGDASFLGQTQMLMSVIFGGLTIYVLPCCVIQRTNFDGHRIAFFRNMSILGCLRFGTVVCSLISLKHVAVSFTETVKASAPLFTVILSFIILRKLHIDCTHFSSLP